MRILVINQYFAPDLASTGQLLTELCEDLAEHHDVWVVCGRPSYGVQGGAATPRLHPRIRVRRVASTSFGRASMAGRLVNYATFLASAAWSALRAPRPDVVLTMTDPPVVASVAAMAATVRRVPYVYVCQDIFPDIAVALGKLRPGLTSRTLARLNHLLRARAATVVAIGRDMRGRLIELGTPADRIVVIPNWADARRITPGKGAAFRAEHGLADRFVVMHSGNVGLSQQLDVLIDAAGMLEDEDMCIVIVGDGASKDDLKQRVEADGRANVLFLPYEPAARLSRSLGAANIHVVGLAPGLAGSIVPSKIYGIMAAGRPFVAAVEPGSEAARVIEETGCGLRVDPGDAGALAAALRRARELTDEELDGMGRGGREALEARFDRPIATAAYRTLLESAVR